MAPAAIATIMNIANVMKKRTSAPNNGNIAIIVVNAEARIERPN